MNVPFFFFVFFFFTLRSNFDRAQSAWAFPTCIFRPKTIGELRAIIPMLAAARTSFAIRSGGHSPHLGASNIGDGVLLDMSEFNGQMYDPQTGSVKVGTGLRWGQVYTYLEQYQVTVVGGRVDDVGVGGLTLGGE